MVAAFYEYRGRPFGCPYCRSSDRERFVLYALENELIEMPTIPCRTLHIAPLEMGLITRFKRFGTYIAGDLDPMAYPNTECRRIDLTSLRTIPQSDLVYASHVLELIPDDLLALRNVFASLAPGGQAWFLVPLRSGKTEDGNPAMTPRQREQRFGYWDPVRIYGMDIVDRMKAASFDVWVISASNLDVETLNTYGLNPHDKIFVGKKSQTPTGRNAENW
jgi:SAM-dependent methyltransferase